MAAPDASGTSTLLLLLVAFASASTQMGELRGQRGAWPNVLAVQGTWLFDQGSNAGYSVRQGPHGGAIAGPSPDWALGSHGTSLFEYDVSVGGQAPTQAQARAGM